MKSLLGLICLLCTSAWLDGPAAQLPKRGPLGTGFGSPQAVAIGTDSRTYVTVCGQVDKDGDGAVLVLDQGRAIPFASGLDDPAGLAVYQEWLYVADKKRVWRIDRKGKASVFAAETAFPTPPLHLQGITADPESGMLYVSDAGNRAGQAGAVYRVSPLGKVNAVTDAKRWPGLHTPSGVALDGAAHLLLADAGTGELHRVKLADASHEKLAGDLGDVRGLAWDKFGRLFISAGKEGRIRVINRPGEQPIPLANGFQQTAGIAVDANGESILVADAKAGTLTAVPKSAPGAAVDETPLPLETAPAFTDLQWTGWQAENDKGKIVPLRPIVLTHAGDGTNRVFVATQHGVIHVFPNDQKATKTQVFLDLQNRVTYDDKQNEEGFLGVAFHPDYKRNGEFFVYYTVKQPKLTNVVSRFRVSRDDPNRADPASEEELLRVTRPFWNHDGGTLCFGPDGYLYIAMGDGGAANDPFDNGQNLKALLGKVLRIDVNTKGENTKYGIPKDNPFVNKPEVRQEIWAYGLRNVWRMAFDRQTGVLWAGDVGQNLYEEINHLSAGGNFGWNRREGLHPFGAKGSGPHRDMIDPIWEYHHDVGKSITGGAVYRGTRVPMLAGAYVYADYVSGKIWALRYDAARQRVVAHQRIKDRSLPILSFGEDEDGDLYFMTFTPTGRGLYRFVPTPTAGSSKP